MQLVGWLAEVHYKCPMLLNNSTEKEKIQISVEKNKYTA